MGEGSDDKVVNEPPKPRVLLSWTFDSPSYDDVRSLLERCAGYLTVASSLDGIRQRDLDIVVTDDFRSLVGHDRGTIDPSLFVISRNRETESYGLLDQWRTHTRKSMSSIDWGVRAQGVENGISIVSKAVPPEFTQVRDDLVEAERRHGSHPVISFNVGSGRQQRPPKPGVDTPPPAPAAAAPTSAAPPAPAVAHRRDFPLLETVDGHPIAGRYYRSDNSEGCIIPARALRPERWVKACLDYWANEYGLWPIRGNWQASPTWMTLAQQRAVTELDEVETEAKRSAERYREHIDVLTKQIEDAGTAAATGAQRLLTSQGDDLVAATHQALVTLGFDVVDLDADGQPTEGGKGEDLRIADPDDSSLDPVVEVKGYDKGAKAGDLRKIQRHKTRAEGAGRAVTGCWWIVNHNRSVAPEDRGPLLPGEDDSIEEAAEPEDLGLLLIDTRDLFLAAKGVENGDLDAVEVRKSLGTSRGRWSLVAPDGDGLPAG